MTALISLILVIILIGYQILLIIRSRGTNEDGEQGVCSCPPGPQGPQGPQGPRGEDGVDGADGGSGTGGSGSFRNSLASELGYEIDVTNGTVIFNRPVKFKNDVEFEDNLFIEHGDNTKYFDTLPPGVILAWRWAEDGSNPIPNGWAICDGNNGTPNLQGRFVLGAGNGTSLTNRNVNGTGGAETVTLGINQIPRHRHTHLMHNSGNNNVLYHNDTHKFASAHHGAMDPKWKSGGINYTGGDANGQTVAHNNMPPFHVLLYIMKLNRYGNNTPDNPYNSNTQKQSEFT